jgi:hypothetical protein
MDVMYNYNYLALCTNVLNLHYTCQYTMFVVINSYTYHVDIQLTRESMIPHLLQSLSLYTRLTTMLSVLYPRYQREFMRRDGEHPRVHDPKWVDLGVDIIYRLYHYRRCYNN